MGKAIVSGSRLALRAHVIRRPRRRREGGFSLLIVFMLMMIMIGVAAGVALTTQEDLSVSGQDREQQMAFYAAEYAVARAKDYLTSSSVYSNATGWTPLLAAGGNVLCQ